MVDSKTIDNTITDQGLSISSMSQKGPVLLIFLRHLNCVFCIEAMKEVGLKKDKWRDQGVQVVLVHPAETSVAAEIFKKYGLSDLEHIADPDCKLYADYGLLKGSFTQLFGLQVMLRGVQVSKSLPTLKVIGDGFQMPGIFLISKGTIKESFVHQRASDKPDYDQMISSYVK